jgi:hypothetical protein
MRKSGASFLCVHHHINRKYKDDLSCALFDTLWDGGNDEVKREIVEGKILTISICGGGGGC